MDTSFPKRGAFDIEASAFGLDFAVLGADATRVTRFHDEVIVDIKTADYADVEKRVAAAMLDQQRQVGKMAAHGAAYASGAAGAAKDSFWTQVTKARVTKSDRAERREQAVYSRHVQSLDHLSEDSDRRWAIAFFEVMRASPAHYAEASPERRRFLREHYTKLAQEDSKRGQRAAKVLVHVVSHAIEGKEPDTDGDFRHIDRMAGTVQHNWHQGRTMTGRMAAAAPARQSLQRAAYDQIIGKSATRIIMDDLT